MRVGITENLRIADAYMYLSLLYLKINKSQSKYKDIDRNGTFEYYDWYKSMSRGEFYGYIFEQF
jgi:hypothetical protein